MKHRFSHWICSSVLGLSVSALALAQISYVVKKGDQLSKVAREQIQAPVWGKAGGLAKLLVLNPKIKNPNLIFPGERILLPERKLSTVSIEKHPCAPRSSNKLSKILGRLIAGPVWGKNGSFAKVLALNPTLKNPDLIHVGEEIQLPSGQRVRVGSLEQSSCESARVPASNADRSEDLPLKQPEKHENASYKEEIMPSDDGSKIAFELSPTLSMTTISSTDQTSGAKDSIASSFDAAIDSRFVQSWDDTFQTYLRGKLSYVSFSQPLNSIQSLSGSSKLLTDFGLGFERTLQSRLKFGLSFDLGQNLFLRAISSSSVTTDSVLIPAFGAQVSYDFVERQAFILGTSLHYSEEMKASTESYSIGLGSLYGGIIEVRGRSAGKETFSVGLGADQRTEKTSFTNQTETSYHLVLRFYFPASSGEGESSKK